MVRQYNIKHKVVIDINPVVLDQGKESFLCRYLYFCISPRQSHFDVFIVNLLETKSFIPILNRILSQKASF